MSAGALVFMGAGLGVWATVFKDDTRELRASETCNEGIFSANVEPLERLISPDSSFTSDWSREASDSSLLLTCVNSTDHASVKMTAELKDGSIDEWRSQLKAVDKADASHFDVGTEAVVWGRHAAMYVECKPQSAGSSHTAGLDSPYLSILVRASGSAAEEKTDKQQQDLAQLASRMFFEAQLQTGCQEDFVAPSGPPRLTK
ncbi:hypothetical protein GTW38_06690 [Streptomyces sp. SID7804]|nr:hypothetical protein [Streptomyces calvus]MBA8975131.1 hypothetical protein [Streptomyces calvus]MYS26629.1 hypothetical protein [Streptomyces sp. SID7804]